MFSCFECELSEHDLLFLLSVLIYAFFLQYICYFNFAWFFSSFVELVKFQVREILKIKTTLPHRSVVTRFHDFLPSAFEGLCHCKERAQDCLLFMLLSAKGTALLPVLCVSLLYLQKPLPVVGIRVQSQQTMNLIECKVHTHTHTTQTDRQTDTHTNLIR